MKPSDLSIIIAAHRNGPMLRSCLEAVHGLDPAPREVIVAVDGGDDDVVATCQRFGFAVVILENAPGVSATRNAGASRAKGRVLAFLDSDVMPRVDHVAQALSTLDRSPGANAAFGSYDDNPAAPGIVSRYRNLLHHYTHQTASHEAQTFWAACGVCEAEAFRAVGGFDECYRKPSIEDIKLGYRLRKAGYRIVLEPSWQIRHLKQWGLSDLLTTDLMLRAYPWTLLLLQEGRLDNDLNIDQRSRLSAILCVFTPLGLLLGIASPGWLVLSGLSLAAWIFLNRGFYEFLVRSRGWGFALMAMPLHQLYYLVALAGYAMGVITWWQGRILRGFTSHAKRTS